MKISALQAVIVALPAAMLLTGAAVAQQTGTPPVPRAAVSVPAQANTAAPLTTLAQNVNDPDAIGGTDMDGPDNDQEGNEANEGRTQP